MAPLIITFCDRYKSRSFRPGKDDCSLFIADWWRENHGVDPAAHLRGTYSDREGMAAVVKENGGLVNLVSGIAEKVGAQVISKPHTGAFAVIAPGVCAIYAEGYWIARTETGLAFNRDAVVLRMWSL